MTMFGRVGRSAARGRNAADPHDDSHVVIDGSRHRIVDVAVREILRDFRIGAPLRGIRAEFRGITL